ncbi:MAG TPA: type I phosphomannose isomerase catalytic subunit [Opitutaceae bacterium]|nr:type I phosphomannose isomerase catalytic subunit [Opitutaceae bacterium]
MEILRFAPIYQERVWGGRALAAAFGRVLPAGRTIGESWEIVDRPEAQAVACGGKQAGHTLRKLIANYGREIMGPRWPVERPFPLLVKWLDCRERLSLQVHPPADKAAELGGEPKTENWFIAEAAPEASLIVGLRQGVTRAEFERALAAGSLEKCVNRIPVAAGDSILVRSGTVHAIDAGNLILEIQQNSDTTYRVYDWGRSGLDGKPRPLHLREALASILWGQPEPQPLRAAADRAVLADCAEFRLRRIPLAGGERLAFSAGQQPRLLHVVQGRVKEAAMDEPLGRGANVLLPFAGAFTFTATENSLLLVTENFT